MEKNILLTIEYDGTNFYGWQRQPERRTVQGEMERVLSIVCGKEAKIDGTSRTDAGVHALGQRASFKGDIKIPADRLVIAANNLLSGGKNAINQTADARIIAAEEKPPEFHARFDAKGKKYIYKISNESQTDIFTRNYAYQITRPLNVNAMEEAAGHIAGEKDFKSFQASGGKEQKTTVRTIHSIKIIKEPDIPGGIKPDALRGIKPDARMNAKPDIPGGAGQGLYIEVIGDGFLYNMVRIIAGTLVEAGLGKINPDDMPSIIKDKDRQRAGHTAPPQGLYLVEIYY